MKQSNHMSSEELPYQTQVCLCSFCGFFPVVSPNGGMHLRLWNDLITSHTIGSTVESNTGVLCSTWCTYSPCWCHSHEFEQFWNLKWKLFIYASNWYEQLSWIAIFREHFWNIRKCKDKLNIIQCHGVLLSIELLLTTIVYCRGLFSFSTLHHNNVISSH